MYSVTSLGALGVSALYNHGTRLWFLCMQRKTTGLCTCFAGRHFGQFSRFFDTLDPGGENDRSGFTHLRKAEEGATPAAWSARVTP